MAVLIPKKVYDQLEEVRLSGETNMYDAVGVMNVASRNGQYALAGWLAGQMVHRSYGVRIDDRQPFPRGLSEGFEPIEEES